MRLGERICTAHAKYLFFPTKACVSIEAGVEEGVQGRESVWRSSAIIVPAEKQDMRGRELAYWAGFEGRQSDVRQASRP